MFQKINWYSLEKFIGPLVPSPTLIKFLSLQKRTRVEKEYVLTRDWPYPCLMDYGSQSSEGKLIKWYHKKSNIGKEKTYHK